MALSGLYSADYYRKAVHKIKVDDNVKEVLVGPDTFEVSKKSKFSKIVNTTGKRTINLDLEEHVFVKNTGTLYLDHQNDSKTTVCIGSQTHGNYGSKVLAAEKTKEHEISEIDALIRILKDTTRSSKTFQILFVSSSCLAIFCNFDQFETFPIQTWILWPTAGPCSYLNVLSRIIFCIF